MTVGNGRELHPTGRVGRHCPKPMGSGLPQVPGAKRQGRPLAGWAKPITWPIPVGMSPVIASIGVHSPRNDRGLSLRAI